ncbi:MAG: SelB C-terminal domain-containing protein, partial [Nitrospirae bacterium]|nr:SelB C-terminal domain-containing protein [Nitrospirota bacterium]
CYCQFRLEEPVVALSGDRYIIRRFSPLETIGGGEILDPYPVRRRKKAGIDDLVVFKKGTLKEKIETKVRRAHFNGCTVSEIEGWVQGNIPEINAGVEQLLEEGILVRSRDVLFHRDGFKAFREALISALSRFHKDNPLKSGMSKEELKVKVLTPHFSSLASLVEDVVVDKEMLRLRSFKVALSSVDEDSKNRILSVLDKDGFQPPLKAELVRQLSISARELDDLIKLLTREGALVRINDSLYITGKQYDKMIALMKDFYSKKPEMTIAEFRDILGTTRKYALPLVEYLDSHRITLRVGDIRKLMLK